MFRYSIFAVAIALLVPTSVAWGGSPDESCHVSVSCTGKRSLLQTSGGVLDKLPPGRHTAQYQVREDDTVMSNEAPTEASSRISQRFPESVGMLHSTPSKFLQSLGGLGYADEDVVLDHAHLATHDNSGVAQKLPQRGNFMVEHSFTDDGTAMSSQTGMSQNPSQYVVRLHDQEDNIAMFSQPPTDANTVTLDETGYQEVAALCCVDDMRTFVRRVAAAESYIICDEGGLSGLLWWYDCPDDQMNYANLVAAIKAASTSACVWVSPAGQDCAKLPDECLISNPEPLPKCLRTSTITTTMGDIPGQLAATTSTTTVFSNQLLEAATTTLQEITLICCAPQPQAGLLQVSALATPSITVAGNGSHGVSTATNGGKIWKDRDYVFQGLSSDFQGAMLFQGPVRTPPGDVLTLNCGGSGGVLYALLSQNRSGTFPTTLVHHGWTKTAESVSWANGGQQFGTFDVYQKRGCKTTLPASSGSDVVATFLHTPEKKALLAVKSRNAASRTAVFDCSTHTLPIQVWAPSVTDPVYSVSELNVFTGQYDLIYSIPRTITTPSFSQLNSAGISPVDSKAYGTLLLDGSNDYYVVRHDKDGVEFVGRFPPSWTNKGTGYNVAAFSLSGNYYLMTKNKEQNIFVIKDLHSKPGFPGQLPAQGLEDFEPEMKSSKFSLGVTGSIADIAAVPMDLDGSNDVTDYVFGLSKTRILYVVKIGAPNVMWKLKASGTGLTKATAGKGFGAAWSYGQRVFMAANSGQGVFEVDMSTINLTALTVTMKYVGDSAATMANDGMNCLNAKSPWPEQGACDDGEVQLDSVNGACPVGSVSK